MPVPVVFIAGECLLGLGRGVSSTPRAEHPPLPAHVAPLPPCETAPRRVLSTLPARTPARTRGSGPPSGATQPAWLMRVEGRPAQILSTFANDDGVPHRQLSRNRKTNLSALNKLLIVIYSLDSAVKSL